MKTLLQTIAKARGQACAFRMLDPQSSDPAAEIQAAKDTGTMLEATLLELYNLARGAHNE